VHIRELRLNCTSGASQLGQRLHLAETSSADFTMRHCYD
jgi:hypothetical protein